MLFGHSVGPVFGAHEVVVGSGKLVLEGCRRLSRGFECDDGCSETCKCNLRDLSDCRENFRKAAYLIDGNIVDEDGNSLLHEMLFL